MSEEKSIKLALFEQKQLRRVWHKEEWYYSVVDVIAILTDPKQPSAYWGVLKARLKLEGLDEALVQIEQLKLKSAIDGRFRLTDTANRQTLLRIIQSIVSSENHLELKKGKGKSKRLSNSTPVKSKEQERLDQKPQPSLFDEPTKEE